MLRRTCGAALLVLAVALPAHAQTTLEWKFTEGQKFYVEDVNDMKQTVALQIGQPIRQNTKYTMVSSYSVKKVMDREATLEWKIESVDVKTASGVDAFGGQMEKIFEKLQGAAFTFKLADGKVSQIQGYEDFIKKASDGDEATAKYAKMLLGESLLRQIIEGTFSDMPRKPVEVGGKWSQEETVPFEQLGSFKSKNDYTLKELEKDLATITYKGTMAYQKPKAGEGVFGGLLKIVKGNLKSDNVKGTIIFYAKKGMLVRRSNSMLIRGSLTVEVMQNQVEMDITVDQTTTSRVLEKAPKIKSD